MLGFLSMIVDTLGSSFSASYGPVENTLFVLKLTFPDVLVGAVDFRVAGFMGSLE
jgi:hypothetical protein